MRKTKYISVPVELAEKIEKMDDNDRMINEAIDKYFDWVVGDLAANLESLDETTLRYKALGIKAREQFKSVALEVASDAEKVWEDWDSAMPNVDTKIAAMRGKLKPLLADFEEINAAITKMDTWRVDRLLETMTKIANADDETKKVLAFLASNYTE